MNQALKDRFIQFLTDYHRLYKESEILHDEFYADDCDASDVFLDMIVDLDLTEYAVNFLDKAKEMEI